MKEKMKKKLQEQRNVRSVMERHLSDWQSVSALVSLYDRFVLNLKKAEDYLALTQQDPEAVKTKIPDLKKQLVDRLHAVSSVLAVYASEEGDRKLRKLAERKRSELKKLKSTELVRQAEKVIGAGKKLNETDVKEMKKAPKFHISGYGLTEKHLELLQKALNDYQKTLLEYVQVKTKVKQSKSKLAKKIQENNLLLRRKMDRVILLFEEVNPAFYEAYTQSGKTSADIKPDKGTKKPAAAAKKPSAAKKPAAGTTRAATPKKPAATTSKPAAAKKPAAGTKQASTSKQSSAQGGS